VALYCGAVAKALDAVFNHHTWLAVLLSALAAIGSPAVARTAADQLAVASANLASASFRSVEIGVDASAIGAKSNDLFYRTNGEYETYSNCGRDGVICPPKVQSWRATIERLGGVDGLELLTAVNAAVNQLITYRDDLTAYGKLDHWATPMESLTGYGDCEDYALVKYVSLIELGVSHDQMRIVVLKDKARNIGHAVLAVTLDDRTYILDNLIARPTLDSALPHYQPIYSFNQTRQWLNVAVRSRDAQVASTETNPGPITVIPPAASNLTGTDRLMTEATVE
jgi:predicted transglutaminase-like cysteine proteinase